MAILHKLFFFLVIGLFCVGAFALTLEFLGAGSYAQSEVVEEQLDLAQQGNAQAQTYIGYLYYNGEGVPTDYQEAAKWYRKAAEQGHARAQYYLGVMYYLGKGVPKDYVLSHMWLNLNLSQQNEDDKRKAGAKVLGTVEGLMTTAQISEAQRLAREFKPKPRF